MSTSPVRQIVCCRKSDRCFGPHCRRGRGRCTSRRLVIPGCAACLPLLRHSGARAARTRNPLGRNDRGWMDSGLAPLRFTPRNDGCSCAFSRHECARVLAISLPLLKAKGAGNAGCALHPRSHTQREKGAHEHTGSAEAPGHPLRNGLRLIPRSPRLVCHRRSADCSTPLDASVGRQDHTALPSASVSLVFRYRLRPSHPAPTFRDDHDTPL